MQQLGIEPSYSRPRVSNDNAYSESLFRTTKYRPDYPSLGFRDLAQAQAWVLKFVRWYNLEHCHSAIRFVTPEQRHSGADVEILRQRETLYERTKQERSEHWSACMQGFTDESHSQVVLLTLYMC